MRCNQINRIICVPGECFGLQMKWENVETNIFRFNCNGNITNWWMTKISVNKPFISTSNYLTVGFSFYYLFLFLELLICIVEFRTAFANVFNRKWMEINLNAYLFAVVIWIVWLSDWHWMVEKTFFVLKKISNLIIDIRCKTSNGFRFFSVSLFGVWFFLVWLSTSVYDK